MAFDLRMLNSLQRIAPVLLRHLDAYFELAAQDWEQAKLTAKRKVMLIGVTAVSAWFSLLMICALVIALTWDTPNRVLAIGIMAALFVIVTVVSAMYVARGQNKAFANLKREWRTDRELLHQYLDDAVPPPRSHPDPTSANASAGMESAGKADLREERARTDRSPSEQRVSGANTRANERGEQSIYAPPGMRPTGTRPVTH